MKQKLLICIAFIFSLSIAYSQNSNLKKAQEALETRGEVNFTFQAENEAQFLEIIKLFIGY